MKLVVLLLVIFVTSLHAAPSRQVTPRASTCGYESCPAVKPGMLNVHLVPHSHDDVGWLKTVDQYFYGSNGKVKKAGVQYIIDSVIDELSKDPSRRFIYVETSFFWMWWIEQNDEMKAKVQEFVETGRLEFISGGWSMNDEAVTHYQSTIDQFTWGLRILNDTFGECGRPRVGWQIDPFGHARETASMMAHLGFDGLLFGRMDFQDLEQRRQTNTTELVWKASANLGDSASLFTSVLHYFYKAPTNFCFDMLCTDAPINDNIRSPDYNKNERVTEFLERTFEQAANYKSGNIIMAMGGDFFYQQADTWFKNMDKLIKYINEMQETEGSKVNLLYSTPSCYLKAVNEAGLEWTTKTDDFFPYANDEHSYWTGYFTSRPTLKYFERKGNNFLQVCKQVLALSGTEEQEWTDLASLREVMGVMQHHDAITGTEKQHVAEDYALRLGQAMADCQDTVNNGINKLMAKTAESPSVLMSSCLLSNISQCDVSESSSKFIVTLYNPMAHVGSQYVRLPVVADQAIFTVTGPTGDEETTQLSLIPEAVTKIPGRISTATHELVFKASNLPPLGFKSYYVEKLPAKETSMPEAVSGVYTIGDKRLRANLDPETGLLSSLQVGKRVVDVSQSFLYYEGAVGDNTKPELRSSGAYVFRPIDNVATPVATNVETLTYTGELFDEVHQKFSDWVSQVIRTYHDEDYLEFEWLVGPIPVDGDIGKEVISRFSKTGWATEGKFYTDSNGREMLERVRDYRPTWNVVLEEPVSGNYYPVTTTLALKNPADDSQLMVLTDRAQGGSSINDGELELMVHRRLMHDDNYGVDEALNEEFEGSPLVVRGRHLVVLGSQTSSPSAMATQRHLTMHQMVMAPWTLLSATELTRQQWADQYMMEWTGLKAPLPDNLHLMTLEPWRSDELLIRLEHFYETNDDTTLSQPASVILEDLFADLEVSSPRETTLGGNQWLAESSRLEWNMEGAPAGSSANQQIRRSDVHVAKAPVELKPMEMRTFVVKKGAADDEEYFWGQHHFRKIMNYFTNSK